MNLEVKEYGKRPDRKLAGKKNTEILIILFINFT